MHIPHSPLEETVDAARVSTTDSDFDLDVTFAEKGTVIAELMNKTSDNCGSTSESACAGCITD
ncbi:MULTISPECIES: FxLD family lanthipeptide [Streptomyces]|uniref:FxLD family lanthipeptide n=1 Tax=Streptomyces TaxID=1883 RepID=UPI002248CDEC|nr:FxLD family lanthipeptide [Streptomyces sp. JHD 1]MCX2968615.1 FxLD family lanthipeptide [Streptomyces sp. JHD 1]